MLSVTGGFGWANRRRGEEDEDERTFHARMISARIGVRSKVESAGADHPSSGTSSSALSTFDLTPIPPTLLMTPAQRGHGFFAWTSISSELRRGMSTSDVKVS